MGLQFGRPMVAIPGPSMVPDRVLNAMHRPMPDIYEGELVDVAWSVLADLPAIAQTDGHVFMAIGNGHAGWQMALSNTLSPNDKILVIEAGFFAVVWGDSAAQTGLDVMRLPSDNQAAADPAAVEAALGKDTDGAIKAVLMVHSDTASSLRNDVAGVRAAIDAAGHDALLMVDCIASLGCDRYEMDAWGVDVTVAASQKGLMMPPGLAFVWASERAMAAHPTAGLRSPYFDWSSRLNVTAVYQLFSGTPPVAHLYGLREALDMIAEEGLEQRWRRHEVLADAVRAAVDAWTTPEGITMNIAEPTHRSNAVTTVRTGSIDPTHLRQLCNDEMGLVLGLGVGGMTTDAFRIGHMGYLNPPALLGTIASIEAGLRALNAPLPTSGIAAATSVVANELWRAAQ